MDLEENYNKIKNSHLKLTEKLIKYEDNYLYLTIDLTNTKKSNKYLYEVNSKLNNEIIEKNKIIKELNKEILLLKKKERNNYFC